MALVTHSSLYCPVLLVQHPFKFFTRSLLCSCYVKKLSVITDDELPDYIMVMVANRKTEEQMAEDLSLFLSNNTNKFTTWFVSALCVNDIIIISFCYLAGKAGI